MVTAKPATAPTSASQRATGASLSRFTASTITPATIGTQIERLRYGSMRAARLAPDPPGQQREDADDHGEGVVIDVPRLDVPQQRRGQLDDLRRAVHEEAVDDRAVADVGEQRADAPEAAGEEPVVEAVDVVVVREELVERPAALAQHRGQLGPADVQVPGGGDASERE